MNMGRLKMNLFSILDFKDILDWQVDKQKEV